MTLLWILGAFLVFMAFIWSAHAVDDYASAGYGYGPFCMPNLLIMLIPNALLLFAVRDAGAGAQTQVMMALAGMAMLGMFLLIKARTSGWIALFAAPMMLFFSPVLVLSVLFRRLAGTERSSGN